MALRAEVTARYARAYARAAKKDKGRVLDQLVGVTGWSRDNARRRLTAAAKRPPGCGRQVTKTSRKPRPLKFSYDALKVLQKVWAACGGQCGRYLAVSMRIQLDGLERHGELALDGTGRADPDGRYSPAVREELLAMSSASIDRYLKPAKATDQISGVSTTKPSPLLRSSIKIRRAGDEVEAEPGFFEGDTVAHCGPTLKGEFARRVRPFQRRVLPLQPANLRRLLRRLAHPLTRLASAASGARVSILPWNHHRTSDLLRLCEGSSTPGSPSQPDPGPLSHPSRWEQPG